jgi:hypothetical protein
MPVLLTPRRGQRSAAHDCGPILTDQRAQVQRTSGTTFLVADRALARAAHLPKLAAPRLQWSTRVPATLREAQAVLAPAEPQTRAPRTEGSRSHGGPARYGGVAPRWGLLHSAPRQPQAQRPVAQPWLQQRAHAVHACKTLGRTACACDAEAPQALARVAHAMPPTCLHHRTVCPTPQSGQRGRPGPGAQPAQSGYQIAGALASRLTDRPARVDQQRWCLLATHALDEGQFSSQAVRDGSTGPARAARGVRFLNAPQFLAASLARTKPARLQALLRVMTVCVLV